MKSKTHFYRKWQHPTLSGDFEMQEIVDLLKQSDHTEVHIGCDSHKRKGHPGEWMFANEICLYTPGKSGTYFFRKVVVKRNYKDDLSSRIMEEATQAIKLANDVAHLLPTKKIYVHSDTNTDSRYPTSRFTTAIKNWAQSSGFNFVCKPDSWASSCVADRHAK